LLKSLSNLDPKRQKLVVLILPTTTLLLTLAALIPAAQRYDESKRQLEKMRSETAALIHSLPKPDNSRSYYLRYDSRESTMFLREIAAIAKGSECELSALSATAVQEPASNGGEKGSSQSPWLVAPVTVQVSLVGSYPNIRRFLSGVINSQRLYSITGLDLRARWKAEDGTPDTRVSAVIRVERYVAMRARPSGKISPAPADQGMPGLK